MWHCEICKQKFNDKTMAVEVRFGYVDSEETAKDGDQYMAFNTENAWAHKIHDFGSYPKK